MPAVEAGRGGEPAMSEQSTAKVVMADNDDDEDAVVTVCQGPPACDLTGDDAVKAQQAGCQWCKRIYIASDGTETVVEPARA
jgi:hypothetical protein